MLHHVARQSNAQRASTWKCQVSRRLPTNLSRPLVRAWWYSLTFGHGGATLEFVLTACHPAQAGRSRHTVSHASLSGKIRRFYCSF